MCQVDRKSNPISTRYSAARKELAQWLGEGKIQRKETIVKGGLEAAEGALIDLYNGINTGRQYLSALHLPVSLVGIMLIQQTH